MAAVIDEAPRRGQPPDTDTVAIGEFGEFGAFDDLQVIQPDADNREHHRHRRRQRGDPGLQFGDWPVGFLAANLRQFTATLSLRDTAHPLARPCL